MQVAPGKLKSRPAMVYTESSDLDGASLLPRFVGGRQYLSMRLLSIGRQGCASPTALLGGQCNLKLFVTEQCTHWHGSKTIEI